MPARSRSALALAILRALVLLLAGFSLVQSPAGLALGEAVASGLAALAAPLLQLVDPAIRQSGTELRGIGWGVRVGEVCDGMGLAVALAAGLAALAADWRDGLRRLLLGLLAIQLFNLLRILALALLLRGAPGGFELVHSGLFPLLTVALLALLLLPMGQGGRLAALGLGLGLLWLPLAPFSSALLAPPVNLLLEALAPAAVGSIAERAAGWTVGTMLLAGLEPVSLHLAPLRPADFAFALPGLLAALLLARPPLWLGVALLLLALAGMLAAIALAAVNAVWTVAAAQSPAQLLRPDGSGAYLPVAFSPGPLALGLLRLGQNALVHLTLLVLPALILARVPRHG